MTHSPLRRSEPYAECRGNSTHTYEQNGIGFDQDGKALGRIDYAKNRLVPFSKRGRPKASVSEEGLQARSPDPDADPNPAEPEVQPEPEPEAESEPEPDSVEPVDVNGNFIVARAAVRKITGVRAANKEQLLDLVDEFDIPVVTPPAEGDG